MINYPKTLEEARKYRYGKGNPAGTSEYKAHRCAFEVPESKWYYAHQCYYINGHGIGGLYCRQHAKKIKETEK